MKFSIHGVATTETAEITFKTKLRQKNRRTQENHIKVLGQT